MGLFDTIVFMFTIYAQPLLRTRFLSMAVLNLRQREVGINLYRLFWPCLYLDEKWPRSQLSYMFQMLDSMYIYMAVSRNKIIIRVSHVIVPRISYGIHVLENNAEAWWFRELSASDVYISVFKFLTHWPLGCLNVFYSNFLKQISR